MAITQRCSVCDRVLLRPPESDGTWLRCPWCASEFEATVAPQAEAWVEGSVVRDTSPTWETMRDAGRGGWG